MRPLIYILINLPIWIVGAFLSAVMVAMTFIGAIAAALFTLGYHLYQDNKHHIHNNLERK